MNDVILHMWPEADGLPSSSPYCLKVLYALAYKGVAHEIEYLTRRPPDWIRSGKLPAAEIRGEKVEDSTTILKTLDRHWPDLRLYPADAKRRAATNLLEEWADESLALQLVYHRWAVDANFTRFLPQVFGPAPSEARDQAVKAARDFHLELFRDRGIAFLSDAERRARFDEQLEIVELRLDDSHFLTGEEPTAADFAVFAPLHVMQAAKLPELVPLIENRPEVVTWLGRMSQYART